MFVLSQDSSATTYTSSSTSTTSSNQNNCGKEQIVNRTNSTAVTAMGSFGEEIKEQEQKPKKKGVLQIFKQNLKHLLNFRKTNSLTSNTTVPPKAGNPLKLSEPLQSSAVEPTSTITFTHGNRRGDYLPGLPRHGTCLPNPPLDPSTPFEEAQKKGTPIYGAAIFGESSPPTMRNVRRDLWPDGSPRSIEDIRIDEMLNRLEYVQELVNNKNVLDLIKETYVGYKCILALAQPSKEYIDQPEGLFLIELMKMEKSGVLPIFSKLCDLRSQASTLASSNQKNKESQLQAITKQIKELVASDEEIQALETLKPFIADPAKESPQPEPGSQLSPPTPRINLAQSLYQKYTKEKDKTQKLILLKEIRGEAISLVQAAFFHQSKGPGKELKDRLAQYRDFLNNQKRNSSSSNCPPLHPNAIRSSDGISSSLEYVSYREFQSSMSVDSASKDYTASQDDNHTPIDNDEDDTPISALPVHPVSVSINKIVSSAQGSIKTLRQTQAAVLKLKVDVNITPKSTPSSSISSIPSLKDTPVNDSNTPTEPVELRRQNVIFTRQIGPRRTERQTVL